VHYYSFNIELYVAHTRHLSPIEDIAYRRLLDRYYLSEAPLQGDVKKIARYAGMAGHEEDVATVLEEFFEETPDGWRNARADEEIAEYHGKSATARRAGRISGEARRARSRAAAQEREELDSADPCDEGASPSHDERPFNGRSTERERPLNDRSANVERNANDRSTDVAVPFNQLRTKNDELGTRNEVHPDPPEGDLPPQGGSACSGSDPPEPKRGPPEGFDEFWDAFAKKVDRPAAERAWRKLKPKPELIATIVARARAYVRTTPDKGFRRNPATWLNGRGWEDELIERGTGPPGRPRVPKITPPGYYSDTPTISDL
jgi:uncharacterized protein YdaU (DUF1376 family)